MGAITTVGLAKTISDIITEALDFAKKAKNAELAEKLIELYQDFIQLSEINRQLTSKVQELEERIAELTKRPDIAAKLRPVYGSSYNLILDDGKEDGPFCTVCWDVDGRLVRQSRIGTMWVCQYCVTARVGTARKR